MEMNVVVFNYWPRALADVYVNGKHAGAGFGAYGPGGTGGSIYCCHDVRPGTMTVEWMLGGPEGDPLTGTTMRTQATLPAIPPGARYLAVYLYPDGTAHLAAGKVIPDDRPAPQAVTP